MTVSTPTVPSQIKDLGQRLLGADVRVEIQERWWDDTCVIVAQWPDGFTANHDVAMGDLKDSSSAGMALSAFKHIAAHRERHLMKDLPMATYTTFDGLANDVAKMGSGQLMIAPDIYHRILNEARNMSVLTDTLRSSDSICGIPFAVNKYLPPGKFALVSADWRNGEMSYGSIPIPYTPEKLGRGAVAPLKQGGPDKFRGSVDGYYIMDEAGAIPSSWFPPEPPPIPAPEPPPSVTRSNPQFGIF